jgi:protein-S-isoprenylcysteine O-methyltransferase Ste14
MPAKAQSATKRSAVVWLLLLCLVVYRVFHMPPAAADRIRASFLLHWPLWASGALWILFSIYWEIVAKNAARDKSSESTASRGLHVFMVNAALLLLFVPVPGLTRRYLRAPQVFVSLGLTLQICAVLLALWARRHLGRNWSGRITIKVDHELVQSGPYRFVRHPIYTALLGMYAGTAIVSGEWHAMLGFALAAFAYWRKIRMEEANLAAAFGPAWTEYRRSTSSLLPIGYTRLQSRSNRSSPPQ